MSGKFGFQCKARFISEIACNMVPSALRCSRGVEHGINVFRPVGAQNLKRITVQPRRRGIRNAGIVEQDKRRRGIDHRVSL
jgi:hypothetical protein